MAQTMRYSVKHLYSLNTVSLVCDPQSLLVFQTGSGTKHLMGYSRQDKGLAGAYHSLSDGQHSLEGGHRAFGI